MSHDTVPTAHPGLPPRYLPVHVPRQPQPRTRTATVHAWRALWDVGGVLHARWEDIRRAPSAGWHGMANWLKVLLAVTAASIEVLVVYAGAGVLADPLHQLTSGLLARIDVLSRVWAVTDQPVHSYITHHSAGLAISGTTIYWVWQVAGLTGLIGGFLHHTGARFTWIGWGAATTAMAWTATPTAGRALATAITVLLWTLASPIALRGLRLHPIRATSVNVTVALPAPRIRTEVVVHTVNTTPGDNTPNDPPQSHPQ
ncbi:hypothetical protein [Streptomyces sp. NPDC101455]|uniref:hypothetical protein n=1 Tax=Streptomyces sp. NPDC101455 TaxID=3366142 RepID=UPI0037FC25BD